MKNFSISSIAWDKSENEAIVDLFKKYKITNLECAPGIFSKPLLNLANKEIEEEKKYWNSEGVSIPAMQALLYNMPELSLFKTEEEREKLRLYLKKIFFIANELGVKSLVFGSPKNRQKGELDEQEAFNIATSFFKKVAHDATECACTLCIEANAKDYSCDFITSHEEAIELVHAVNSKGFGLQIDTGVMLMNGENINSLTEKMCQYNILPQHVHLSAPFLEPLSKENMQFYNEVKQVLEKLNYNGLFSLEMKKTSNNSNIATIQQVVSQIHEIWT